MELWARAATYAQRDPNPVRAGFLLQSLNDAIDLDAARWMAIRDQVPTNVIYVSHAYDRECAQASTPVADINISMLSSRILFLPNVFFVPH